MNNITIGILGGMGPRATLEFQSRLLEQFSGSDQSIPRIICSNNGAIPDRSSFLVEDGADPLDVLISEAQLLTRSGVDIVCMPCNTAHSPKILSRLMAQVPLPIIDMPAACMLRVEKMQIEKVLILGTNGSRAGKIFDTRSVNITCIYPDEAEQSFVDKLIKTIKNGLALKPVQLNQLTAIITDSEAEAVVLGCTELSLVSKHLGVVPVIDSMDVLAKTCASLCMEYTNIKETT